MAENIDPTEYGLETDYQKTKDLVESWKVSLQSNNLTPNYGQTHLITGIDLLNNRLEYKVVDNGTEHRQSHYFNYAPTVQDDPIAEAAIYSAIQQWFNSEAASYVTAPALPPTDDFEIEEIRGTIANDKAQNTDQFLQMQNEINLKDKQLENMGKRMELMADAIEHQFKSIPKSSPSEPSDVIYEPGTYFICCIKTMQKGASFCDCGRAMTSHLREAMGMPEDAR